MTTPAEFRPLRAAVIGLGAIGRDHATILASLPEVECVAAADIDPSRAAACPPGVEFMSDPLRLLDRGDIEAVWICTPQHLHREWVVAALQRDLHVFCEKPIAHTVEDADAMIAEAARASTLLCIGHTLRFHPDYQAAQSAVANGRVGRPVHLSARWNTGDHEGRVISGRTTVPLEMSIHDIDVLRWIAGDITEVFALAATETPCGPGPDAVVGTARFASGAVAALEHNWLMPSATGMFSDHRLAVFGTTGSVYVNLRDTPTQIYGNDGLLLPRTTYRLTSHGIPSGALANADRHFVQSVRRGLAWPLDLSDARAALTVALAMDRSVAEHRPVRIDELKGAAGENHSN